MNNLTNGGSKDGIGISSWKEEWKLASAFGRINYNYDQRYYINASIRAEGSSKFGANNRWGYFPSVSASWLITNESFMRGQDVVKELKLRAGYGVTGNMPILELIKWLHGLWQQFQILTLNGKPNTRLMWVLILHSCKVV